MDSFCWQKVSIPDKSNHTNIMRKYVSVLCVYLLPLFRPKCWTDFDDFFIAIEVGFIQKRGYILKTPTIHLVPIPTS